MRLNSSILSTQQNTSAKVKNVLFILSESVTWFCAKKGVESLTVLIPLPEELKEKELARLKKEQTKLEGQLSSLEKRFKNKEFLEKAPQEVLEKLKGQRDKVKSALEAIYAKIS